MVSLTRRNATKQLTWNAPEGASARGYRSLKTDCLRAFSELFQLATVECPDWIRDSAFAIEG